MNNTIRLAGLAALLAICSALCAKPSPPPVARSGPHHGGHPSSHHHHNGHDSHHHGHHGTAGGRPPMRPLEVRGPVGRDGRVHVALYASAYGTRLKSGHTVYHGSNHRHWTRRHFHAGRRAWFYYDPSTRGWFYYSSARTMFLPARFVNVVPPAAGAVPGIDAPLASPAEAPDNIPEPA